MRALRYLVGLVGRGQLEVPVGWRGDWHSYEDALAQLLDRQDRGKAVLEIATP